MQTLFDNKSLKQPLVSIILLDWSVRESFHTLDYLNKQTVPREQYEIIWIEYYSRRPADIEKKIKEYEESVRPALLDTWIVLDIPDNTYYHKHLMYNMGIVSSKGKIITVMDSDAVVKSTFVESVIKSFEEDSNIVLHIDEVRNINRKYYPFNYPSVEEIMEEGCINWKDRTTFGLIDEKDPIHSLNYGACMCALRKDLISIGGADEHMDYLGHICGPYEMTFRLVNAGKKEAWHQREFLYHTWHPGTDGKMNYLGPHDGFNMSATALKIRNSGRILPLDENSVIKEIRLNGNYDAESLLFKAIDDNKIRKWTIESAKEDNRYFSDAMIKLKRSPASALSVAGTFIKIFASQFYEQVAGFLKKPKSPREIIMAGFYAYRFLRNKSKHNKYVLENCERCLKDLALSDAKEIAIYGSKEIVRVLYKLSLNSQVKIIAVYDDNNQVGRKFFDLNIMPFEEIRTYSGKIVIAEPDGVEDRIEKLLNMGIERSRLITLF